MSQPTVVLNYERSGNAAVFSDRRAMFEMLYASGADVYVMVDVVKCGSGSGMPGDGAIPGVAVLGYSQGRARDMVVDGLGVRAFLSFDKVPRRTFFPWEAVVGMKCEVNDKTLVTVNYAVDLVTLGGTVEPEARRN